MCGISGIVAAHREGLRAVAAAQIPLLNHRGPDIRGHFEASGGVIAQNRPAIIDLVSGDPPNTNEARSMAVVLSGQSNKIRKPRTELLRPDRSSARSEPREATAHLAENLSPRGSCPPARRHLRARPRAAPRTLLGAAAGMARWW